MSYVERLVSGGPVVCTWEQVAVDDRAQRVVPDGCVDMVWSGGELTVAGPDTGARVVSLPAGTRVVGLRLAPGVAGAAFGLPASELCDEQPLAAEILGRDAALRLTDALAAGVDAHAALLAAIPRAAPDPLIQATIDALGQPGARVAGVAADIGFSERQLRRRVADAVGYGPKVLARVLRLRRLQALPAEVPLARRAMEAGYADQAHMTAEVTRLTGLSPVRFLKDRTPTAA